MKTHCNQKTFEFQTENLHKIIAHFNGGNISSDSGVLLLQQTERITGIISQFANCFDDHRDPDLIEPVGWGLYPTNLLCFCASFNPALDTLVFFRYRLSP